MMNSPGVLAVTVSVANLLAQVTEPLPNIPGVVSSMTSTGVLIWYLWYSTTRVIPGLTEKFNAELKEMRDAFNELHDKYITELGKMRDAFVMDQRATREHYEKQLQAMRELCPKPKDG